MHEQTQRYSGIAMLLHWAIAILISTNLIASFVEIPFLKGTHKSIGMAVLLLTLVRLFWRLGHKPPELPAKLAGWERGLARFTHGIFYALLLAIPLLGWAATSAGSRGTGVLFGGIQWFDLPLTKSPELREALGSAHGLMSYLALVLILLHVAGALKHQFVDRLPFINRMLPGGS